MKKLSLIAFLIGWCSFSAVEAGLWADYELEVRPAGYVSELSSENHGSVLSPEGLQRRARKLAQTSFKPLTCNAAYSSCISWTSAQGPYTNSTTGWVRIPCGKCVTMDITDRRTVNIAGGLQIQGKLVIPPTARVTLAMTMMVVEGELEITSTDTITGTPKVTFQIKNSASVPSFKPHPLNAKACDYTTCQLGSQAIVVAGGKLTIKGMPDNCPAWTTVDGIKSGEIAVATSNSATLGNKTNVVPAGCDESGVIISTDFSDGATGGWNGELGTISKIVAGDNSWDGSSSYLSITSRSATWQGTNYIVPDGTLKCLQPNVPFMFNAKVRLTGADGKVSRCSSGKTDPTALNNCPKLRLNYIDSNGINIWRVLTSVGPSQVRADGVWMNLTSSITFTKVELAKTNMYLKLTIDGPEADVNMAVGDISLSSPIAAMASAGPITCDNLIVNGKAESGIAFPWTTYVSTDPEPTVQTDNTGNKYFTQTQRNYPYSSISISLNPECVISGSTYAFSSQLRVKSPGSSTFRVILKATQADGGGTQVAIASCQPGPDSWTTCAASYTFSDTDETAASLQIYFYGVTDSTSDVDYDNIGLIFVSAGGSRAILPKSVASCWGPNATLAVTSEGLTYNGGTTTIIDNIDKSTGVLKPKTPFTIPTTVAASSDYAGHLALLSRNILFKGVDGSTSAGPHLIIYKTPGVAQLIDGVAFSGFGRPGEAQRFPINFYMSGNATGSVISRNSITNSMQRCIVLSGTNNVKVTGNVAYNTAGHCYVLEQGSEKGNLFDGNFGALQTAPTSIISAAATDSNPATFYITAPDNSFTNNIAAGSYGHGWWINAPMAVIGDSAPDNVGYSPANVPLKVFEGNVAHSNRFYGLNQAAGYTPSRASVIKGLRSYRNSVGGVYFWNARNIHFDDAVLADNKVGFNLNNLNGLVVQNAVIIGYSPEYQKSVASDGYASHCYGTSAGLYGIELSVSGMDPAWGGNLISNVTFENFSNATGCLGNKALLFNPFSTTKSNDVTTSFENLSFGDTELDAANKFSLCDAENNGISNVLTSVDSSLLPENSGDGVIVSNNPTLLANMKNCVNIPGACAAFCPMEKGACVRQISVSIVHHTSDNLFLIVTGADKTLNITGSFTPESETVDTLWTSRTLFSFALGAGSYSGTFKDSLGNVVWPGGVSITYGSAPMCNGYFESFDIEAPKPSSSACFDLIDQSNFADGPLSANLWSHTGGGIVVTEPGYPQSGFGLQTVSRTAVSQGPAYFVDTRCLKTVGLQYLLSAQVYLINSKTQLVEHCDASDRFGAYRCPRGNLVTFKDSNLTSFQFGAAAAVGPWYNGSWNALRGPIIVDEVVADADFVAVYFDDVRVGVEIRIDEVHMTPFKVACPTALNQIKNGGFEQGTYEFWWYYGSTTKLQIVRPGYNKSDFALSTVRRDSPTVGLTQELNPSCLKKNELYVISLHFQLRDYDGTLFDCNPYGTDTTVCPSASLQVTNGAKVTWLLVGSAVGPINSDWPLITGVFNATESITNASALQLHINNAWSGYNLIIDDVDLSLASGHSQSETGVSQSFISGGECSNLAQNGDLSAGDARFWDVIGPGTELEMFSYESSSSPALKVTSRSVSFAGAKQAVNQACLIEGDSWTVQAKFKMMSGTDPVGCDPEATWGDNQCPGITLTASKRDDETSGTLTKVLTLRNMVEKPWETTDFNNFHSSFTITGEMAKWDSLVFSTDLTRPGVDVIFDDLRIIPSSL